MKMNDFGKIFPWFHTQVFFFFLRRECPEGSTKPLLNFQSKRTTISIFIFPKQPFFTFGRSETLVFASFISRKFISFLPTYPIYLSILPYLKYLEVKKLDHQLR